MRPSAYLDSVSDDGSKVTYYYEIDYSTTDNELGPFDDYELLYDRGTGATEPVETAGDDTFVSGQYDGVNGSVLSGNGKYLTFTSTSPDAAAGDLNTGSDAYEEAFTGAPLTYLYAKASTHGLTVHWKNPKQFTRVTVRMRAGKVAPKCSTCGHAVYRGRGATAKIHKLRPGKHYTVAVFTHLNKKLISRKVYVATTKRS
jgi:hypothetical protein